MTGRIGHDWVAFEGDREAFRPPNNNLEGPVTTPYLSHYPANIPERPQDGPYGSETLGARNVPVMTNMANTDRLVGLAPILQDQKGFARWVDAGPARG